MNCADLPQSNLTFHKIDQPSIECKSLVEKHKINIEDYTKRIFEKFEPVKMAYKSSNPQAYSIKIKVSPVEYIHVKITFQTIKGEEDSYVDNVETGQSKLTPLIPF